MISIKGYGLFNIFYIFLSIIITKFYFRKARIIRFPFFIRCNGLLILGNRFTSGHSLRIDVHNSGKLIIGENVQFNDNCQIACAESITICENVLIASKVFITDHDHDFNRIKGAAISDLIAKAVIIEKNCWIGNGVSILKGVTIGEGSRVAAGAIVTKSFPPYSDIAGVPARQI